MNALLRLAAWILAIALVAMPIVAVLNGWIGGERWPMQRLVLTGEFHLVEDEKVRQAVLPLVGRGFFAVDLGAVRDAVAALPWVASVQVRKRWPDRLEISLQEHRPLAHWGEDRMLAENGKLFAQPAGIDALPALPRFDGPDERAAEVRDFHAALAPQFLRQGLTLRRVELSARGSWRLELVGQGEGASAFAIEVGRDQPEQRVARFLRLWPALLRSEPRPLQHADLRYTNGFALIWQAPPADAPVIEHEVQAHT